MCIFKQVNHRFSYHSPGEFLFLSFPQLSASSSFRCIYSPTFLLTTFPLIHLSILSSSHLILFFSCRSSVIGILRFSTKTAGWLLKKNSRAVAFNARYGTLLLSILYLPFYSCEMSRANLRCATVQEQLAASEDEQDQYLLWRERIPSQFVYKKFCQFNRFVVLIRNGSVTCKPLKCFQNEQSSRLPSEH